METDTWRAVLAAALAVNAALGLGYRVIRLARGGPMADVVGQALLGVLLLALAVGAYMGMGVAITGSLLYGVLYGTVVMPIWTLAVLIPMRPERVDKVFTMVYWLLLAVIVVAAIAV
jgi:hypothetical protein